MPLISATSLNRKSGGSEVEGTAVHPAAVSVSGNPDFDEAGPQKKLP
jgi:hypothetical protein